MSEGSLENGFRGGRGSRGLYVADYITHLAPLSIRQFIYQLSAVRKRHQSYLYFFNYTVILIIIVLCLHDRATVRSGAAIGLLSKELSVSQGVALEDFLLTPTCPIE